MMHLKISLADYIATLQGARMLDERWGAIQMERHTTEQWAVNDYGAYWLPREARQRDKNLELYEEINSIKAEVSATAYFYEPGSYVLQ